ncbi:MAG: hypothetical protein ACT4O0_08975 [Pseudonocardia sp.]|jgi:hypothetical protein
MRNTAAITVIGAIIALSTALLAPSAFAGERDDNDRDDDCHSCSYDDDDDRDRDDDGGLLDLGGVLDDLLDTVGGLL